MSFGRRHPKNVSSINNMTAATPLHNLFVRCPDGQLICLNNVDVATETSTDLKRRIVQKWQPNNIVSVDDSADAAKSFFLLRFFTFVGIMTRLQSAKILVANEMYLSYSGKPLAESHCNTGTCDATLPSLAKYNLRNDATIQAAIRVRGGCFMVSLSILCIIVGGECLFMHCACWRRYTKAAQSVEISTFVSLVFHYLSQY